MRAQAQADAIALVASKLQVRDGDHAAALAAQEAAKILIAKEVTK
jgi:hypothetical protein